MEKHIIIKIQQKAHLMCPSDPVFNVRDGSKVNGMRKIFLDVLFKSNNMIHFS